MPAGRESLPPQTGAALHLPNIALTLALRTRTFSPQEFPGINAAAVAIVPVKVDGVLAYRSDFEWARRLLIHRQGARFGLWRLPDFASRGPAFLITGRARARIAQPGERIVAPVTVFPVNIHALTSAFFHPDRAWIGGRKGQNTRLFGLNAAHLLG